ncbi:hypothetical protein ACFL5D_05695 [Candidatus Neomarinimicrobiota bacterium]
MLRLGDMADDEIDIFGFDPNTLETLRIIINKRALVDNINFLFDLNLKYFIIRLYLFM